MAKPRKHGFLAHVLHCLYAAKHELRMLKDGEARSPGSASFRHLVIRHYFELRHSDFVIFAHSASLLLSTSPNFGENQCSSLASVQIVRACGFNSGTARTAMRRKCLVSRASFRQVPMLFRNSFFETASSAST